MPTDLTRRQLLHRGALSGAALGTWSMFSGPTAPHGTAGEYLTVPLKDVSGAGGIAGPIGLGLRVPMLVISPFSRGGFVSSQTFDHTSTLKFLAARFRREGVHVPNISAWRDRTVGDLTSAFNFARVNPSEPTGPGIQYASVRVNHSAPRQEPGRARRPIGPVACRRR